MKQNEIRINVEEKLTGMFCETIFMIILSCLGHIEWGGVAVRICVLLGILIGKIIG